MSTSLRRPWLPGSSRIDALLAVIVATEDDLKAILSRQYPDWIDVTWDRWRTDGAPKFFHPLVCDHRYRVECKVDEIALAAGQCEIHVAHKLSPVERMLFAALRTDDGDQIRHSSSPSLAAPAMLTASSPGEQPGGGDLSNVSKVSTAGRAS